MRPMSTFVEPPVTDQQKILELKMAAFIAKNASFSAVEDLTELINSAKPKYAVKNIKLGRTKCTRLITNVLGPAFKDEILKDVDGGKFSIIIDEATDVSTSAVLCLVLRYFSNSKKKVETAFYRLLQLNGKDAESITNAIVTALKEDRLDIRNLIGIGTDGASVLTGCHSGVFQRLKQYQPELLQIRCICHSLALAAKEAVKKLPSNLVVLVKRTYKWFCRSSLRKETYAKLYEEMTGGQPLQILRLVDTRWLSLNNCIGRILSQWDYLTEYFGEVCSTARGEELYKARELLNMFSDQKNRVYLVFLNDLLKDFNRQNVSFQAENANCLQLLSDLRFFYESLLRKFVVGDRLERHLSSDLLSFQFEQYTCAASMIDVGIDCRQQLRSVPDQRDRADILERCKICLIEAASQVKTRIPDSINSLCLIQYLNPEVVLRKNKPNIDDLLLQFPSLVPDPSQAEREYRNLRFHDNLPDQKMDPVQFWLLIQSEKDAAGNSRFQNISDFALALLTMPFSNAAVERVFSVMSLVKTRLRNRLLCQTVESLLFVRYGLKDLTIGLFSPTKDMLRNFSDKMYHDKVEEELDVDIVDAFDVVGASE